MANVSTPKSVDELQRGFYRLAKLKPDHCFQDMYDAICREDVLQHAYLLIRAGNTHACGVDGESLADIPVYGARKWLKELEMDLSDECYRPAPLRRLSIPLPNGQFRTMVIPTLRDEVCMTATMLMIEPILALWLAARFDTNPSSSEHLSNDEEWKGVLAACSLSATNHDESGWFDCLAGVSRTSLAQAIESRIADRRISNLFTMWLACPIEPGGSEHGKRGSLAICDEGDGVSKDLPISPLLTYLVAPQFLPKHENDRPLRSSSEGESGNANLPGSTPPVIERDLFGGTHSWNRTRDTQLGQTLLLSLLLHAALLAIQFGDLGSGLPFFGLQGENREAHIPMLNATLLTKVPPDTSAPVTGMSDMPKAEPETPPMLRPIPLRLIPSTSVTTATINAVKAVASNAEAEDRVRAELAVPSPKSPKTLSAATKVLSTNSESTWSKHIDKPTLDDEDGVVIDSLDENKIAEEQREKEQLQALALIAAEKIQQAAAAKAREDALARQHIEEAARNEAEKLKQIAAAKAKEDDLARAEAERQQEAAIASANEEALVRQRAAELARMEAEKARQLLEAKAMAERSAKRAEMEAEIAARDRAIEAAAQAKKIEAERSLAAERARVAQVTTSIQATSLPLTQSSGGISPIAGSSGREASAGQGAGTGRDLTGQVPDVARNSPPGLLPRNTPENPSPRRASILGRDPKDIQLAFYGEGWRQKVERVGAMNFPKLSKYLVYDPMVVTVSINSDGTLAGVRIVKSSGHVDLDDSVRRIVEMSAPFSAFPPDLKRSFDVADITRTWVFVGDRPQMSRE